MLRMILLGVMGFGAATVAKAETPITLKDPAVLQQQLQEMGYAPEDFDLSGDNPTTVLHLPNETLALVLGGCTEHRDCQYVAGVGHFSDVAHVPSDWVAKMNANYDLIKVWNNDDGFLSYSAGAPLDGVPRATFRAWIEGIITSSHDLAAEAIKAGYASKK